MTRTVTRFDVSKLSTVERTPQGFLRAPAYVTRTGVFKYRKADGSVFRELRHPDEVFKAESLKTLMGAPVTMNHPTGMVNPDNVKQLMVGYTSDAIEQEGQKVKTVVTITDASAISEVEAGKQEVSCGYACELEESSGVYDGEEYDAIQRNIIYNHVAVVDRGRAGPEVRIRMDSDSAVMDGPEFEAQVVSETTEVETPELDAQDQKGKPQMEKIMLGGQEFEVAPELKAAMEAHLASMQAEMDGYKKQMDEMKPQAEEALKAKADLETVQGKCDALEAELKTRKDAEAMDATKIKEAVKARLAVEKVALSALPQEQLEKLDSMEDIEVMKAVITHRSPSLKLDGKGEQYVCAAFDLIAEQIQTSGDALKRLGADLNRARADGTEDPVEAARKRQNEETLNAWKKPLSAVK